MNPILNRLKKVSPLKVWKNNKEFLAWLSKDRNIALLEELIGKNLKIEALEKNLGAFKVNLICRELDSQDLVLVEVQSNSTDHAHLGQLITLAASLSVSKIVWVAFDFSEEHKLALQWLNKISNSQISLTGAELSLYQIENSSLAVSLRAVCESSNWNKENAFASAKKQEEPEIQSYYWEKLLTYINQNSRTLAVLNRTINRDRIVFETKNHFFKLIAQADLLNNSANQVSVGVEFNVKSSTVQSFLTNDLSPEKKEEIENLVGSQLSWTTDNKHDISNSNDFTRLEKKSFGFDGVILNWQNIDPCNQAEWSIQHRWITEELERLKKIFSQEIGQSSDVSKKEKLENGQNLDLDSEKLLLGTEPKTNSIDEQSYSIENKIQEEVFSG